ncbi:ATP-binding protein, partial [Frankia sp. AgKG'84/4]
MAAAINARVGGDVQGQLVVGEHNVVVHAAAGSVVSLRTEPMPPPRRREPVAMAAPRPGAPLFGRDAQCARIATWLDEQLPVQVHGESGIGRTALLRRIAADRAAVRPVVFLNAAGLSHDDLVQEIFQAFYDVTGYRPPADRLRRLLGSVATMLVIDDFDGTSAELAVLLDLVPSCDVLIGSIQRTLLADGRALHLRGLDDEAARSLVTRQLGRRLTTEERTALEGIRERARGNPRVLVQLALAVRELQEAAEETDGAPVEAEPARITLDAGVAVLAPLLAARLGDAQRDALCALRLVFPYSLPTDALRAACGPAPPGGPEAAGGVDDDDIDPGRLDLLAASGLVEATARGWRLTAALGVAATGHLERPPSAADVADRLVAWGRVAPPGE